VTRVAIVNDLRLAQEALKRTVAQAPGCEVAWVAFDGQEAVRRCAEDRPDLVLMDIVMPQMDGVEATRRIMAATPCPILVVTATMEGNLERVYNALGAGALDAVQGPTFGSGGALEGTQPVLRRIRTLQRMAAQGAALPAPKTAPAPVAAPAPRPPGPPAPPTGAQAVVLAIGASTGGPEALRSVLAGLPSACRPAVVVVQHLGEEFVPGFCSWLQGQLGRSVRPACAGDRPQADVVLVAAGQDHLALAPDGTLHYVREPADEPYRPSVDVLFESLARHGRVGVAALLTGMGRDGAAGLLALKRAGWRTFAQDETSSVVYGMPRAARELGAAHEILPLSALPRALESALAGRPTAARPPETR
jgi:two-component system, chemotaxis family, response regulator WspF